MREHKCIQNENANGSFKAVGEAAKSHNADIPVLANMKAAALLCSKRRNTNWEWRRITKRNVVSRVKGALKDLRNKKTC